MNIRFYSRIYRTIHWAIVISFVFLSLTIFLRMTWMNKNNVSDILQSQLVEKGVVLTEEGTNLDAKKIRKPMWQWHSYIGYVLVGLFSIRFAGILYEEIIINSGIVSRIIGGG